MEIDPEDLRLAKGAVNDLRFIQAAALVAAGFRGKPRALEYMAMLAKLELTIDVWIEEIKAGGQLTRKESK